MRELKRTNEDKRQAIAVAISARPNASDAAIAEHCGTSETMVRGVRRAKCQRGVNVPLSLPPRVAEIVKSHRVSPRTAFRWLAKNDVPPVEVVQHFGTDWHDKTKQRARRRDHDVAPKSMCGWSLRSSLSFLKQADKLACQYGFDAYDTVRLTRIVDAVTEMAARWGTVTP